MKIGTEDNCEITWCYDAASSSLHVVYPARELGYDHDESAEQKLHLILAQALLCVCVLEEINTQFASH